MNSTVNEVRKVVYIAYDFTTGLEDLVLVVRKPDESLLDPNPTVTEQGNGVYTASYTLDVIGVWQESISSITNGDKVVRTIVVESVSIADVKSVVDAVDTKVDEVETK
jgi:hypothetical protein